MGVEWAVINIYKRDEGQGEGVARALEWAVDGSPRSAAKSYSSKRQLASYPAQLRVKVKCLCLRKSFSSPDGEGFPRMYMQKLARLGYSTKSALYMRMY